LNIVISIIFLIQIISFLDYTITEKAMKRMSALSLMYFIQRKATRDIAKQGVSLSFVFLSHLVI